MSPETTNRLAREIQRRAPGAGRCAHGRTFVQRILNHTVLGKVERFDRLFKVADASVHQFGRRAGRPGRKVAGVDKQRAQTA